MAGQAKRHLTGIGGGPRFPVEPLRPAGHRGRASARPGQAQPAAVRGRPVRGPLEDLREKAEQWDSAPRVADTLRHCDAALIVTGMASHALTQVSRAYAERRSILWRCIEKATERHVKASLREMFPDLTSRIW